MSLYNIRTRLSRNDRSRGSRVSGIEELDSRAAALAAEMRRNLAFAETQAANQRWSDIVKGALITY